MDFNYLIPVSILLFLVLFLIFKKFSLLVDNLEFSKHKKIGKKNKSPIVMGGIYIMIIVIFFFKNLSLETKLIFFLLFLVGLLSDRNILTSPNVRIVIQTLLILFLVYLEKLHIYNLRIGVLNIILENYFLSILFTTFCLLILINGSNFIDGLNGLIGGYYLLIFFSIIFISHEKLFIEIFPTNSLDIFILALIIVFIFNIFGKVYYGDGGSYLISIITGFFLINFYNMNNLVSPYYIALLLWYPAFENLFSLIRRVLNTKNISKPDNKHLHQLVFRFLRSTKSFDLKYVNSISSAIILFMNLPSFIIGSYFFFDTKKLICMLAINIIIYCFAYYKIDFFLKKKLLIKR